MKGSTSYIKYFQRNYRWGLKPSHCVTRLCPAQGEAEKWVYDCSWMSVVMRNNLGTFSLPYKSLDIVGCH